MMGPLASHGFLYGPAAGGEFERVEPVTISGSFDWMSENEIIYDTGGAGRYRLATYRLGAGGPKFITRYKYFHQPRVARGSGLMTYNSGTEGADGRLEYSFVVAREGNAKPETLMKVVAKNFPVQAFAEDPGFVKIRTTLAINAPVEQALIAVHERIYRVELDF